MADSTSASVSSSVTNEEFKIVGELIAQGAEAKIYKTTLHSHPVIVKHRFPKRYRHPELDKKLRKRRSKAVCLHALSLN